MEKLINIDNSRKKAILIDSFNYYFELNFVVENSIDILKMSVYETVVIPNLLINIDTICLSKTHDKIFIDVLEFYHKHLVACLHSKQVQNRLLLKTYFFKKIDTLNDLLIEII